MESDFNHKTFAVIGAGPVGCIVAAFLAKTGYKTILCDVIPELVLPALKDGIVIKGAENFKQKVSEVCLNIDDLKEHNPDVIIISTKATAIPLIASAIKSFYREGMYIVSWQNGIDTELSIANVLDKKAIMRAVVNYGCVLTGNAEVMMGFHHPPHYIQELSEESKNAAKSIASALTKSGLHTEHTSELVSMIWKKSCMNASMNPVSAITGMTVLQAMNDPIVFQTVDSLIKECIKIARMNEIELGWEYYSYAINYMKNAGNHKTSMLMDVENKRRTEIDFINGKFVEYGKRAGIETPYNSAILSLVKGIEA
jgi:2-dehydropantoate 2-reductase